MRAQPLLTGYIRENYATSDIVVVSPDSGRVRVAEKWADALGGSPLAFIHKTRGSAGAQPGGVQPGRRRGRGQDLRVDRRHDRHRRHHRRCGQAAARGRRQDVIIAATHGVLSDPAAERLAACGAREVIVTNTLPIDDSSVLLN